MFYVEFLHYIFLSLFIFTSKFDYRDTDENVIRNRRFFIVLSVITLSIIASEECVFVLLACVCMCLVLLLSCF